MTFEFRYCIFVKAKRTMASQTEITLSQSDIRRLKKLGYTIYADIELNTLSVDDNKGVNVYQWSLYED